MEPSQACIDLIVRFEKYRYSAYRPTPNDVWTIGFGHTVDVHEGDVCSYPQALTYLGEDLAPVTRAVNRCVTVPITQDQFDALVSFTFNVGIGAFEESTLLRKLNDGDTGGAASEILKWDHQDGEVLGGLVRRRAAEQHLFLSGGPDELPPAA
jgi:lysozyme